MKMLVTNRKITLSIFMIVVLICIAQTASYAAIISVEPGVNDTSLVVTFNFSYRQDASGYAAQNFLFEWRQKTPPGKWESAEKRYTASWWSYWIPIRIVTDKRSYTIEDLIPGTTYEVRLDSGDIHEGTTNYTPLSILSCVSIDRGDFG